MNANERTAPTPVFRPAATCRWHGGQEDVGADAIRRQFACIDFGEKFQPSQKVAVALGSRGISHLGTIVATMIECLRAMELSPFITPAMGAHGAAKAEGQAKVLHALGVTESAIGAPIVSNMDVVLLGRLDSGAEVFFAKDGLEADHLVVINRVKPHPVLRSEVELGLCKMLAVGCARQKGTSNMHKFGLGSYIVPAAEMILEKAPALCGLAIVKNGSGGIKNLSLLRRGL